MIATGAGTYITIAIVVIVVAAVAGAIGAARTRKRGGGDKGNDQA